MSEHLHEIDQLINSPKHRYPTEINTLLGFMAKTEAGPALSLREKERINMGLSLAAQCSWCTLHVKNSLQARATRTRSWR